MSSYRFSPASRTSRVRLLSSLLVALICAAAASAAGVPRSPKNWSAPPYWQPPQASARESAESLPVAPLPFFAVVPCRLADTRSTSSFTGEYGPPTPSPSVTRTMTVPGNCGVPVTAAAVSLNVIAINPTGPGFLTIWPFGEPFPNSSNLNFDGGDIKTNAAIVPLGTGGDLNFIFGVNAGDLVVDVNGYYESVEMVNSLNTLSGDLTISAGPNVTITPVGNDLEISTSVPQGPQGDPGPQGVPGPQGPVGPTIGFIVDDSWAGPQNPIFTTIGAALTAATPLANINNQIGIRVKSGVYNENLTLPGFVHLHGETGELTYSTRLNGSVTFAAAPGARSSMTGFYMEVSGATAFTVSGSGAILDLYGISANSNGFRPAASVSGGATLVVNDGVIQSGGAVDANPVVLVSGAGSRYNSFRANVTNTAAGIAARAENGARLWLFGPASISGQVLFDSGATGSIADVGLSSGGNTAISKTATSGAISVNKVVLNTSANPAIDNPAGGGTVVYGGLQQAGASTQLFNAGALKVSLPFLDQSAAGLNADTLDTLDSTQFVRNDVAGNQTLAGPLTATAFTGDGANLTNVDAQLLDGLDSTVFLNADAALDARLDAVESSSRFVVDPDLAADASPFFNDIPTALTAAGAATPAIVVVKPGTYNGDITIPGGVHVVAEPGNLTYSVRLNGAVLFSGSQRATLAGFYIEHTDVLGLVRVSGSDPDQPLELFDCSISNSSGPTAVLTSGRLTANDGVLRTTNSGGAAAVVVTGGVFQSYRTNIVEATAGGRSVQATAGTASSFGPASIQGQVDYGGTAGGTLSQVNISSGNIPSVVDASSGTISLTLVGLITTATPPVTNDASGVLVQSMVATNVTLSGSPFSTPAATLTFPVDTGIRRGKAPLSLALLGAAATNATHVVTYDRPFAPGIVPVITLTIEDAGATPTASIRALYNVTAVSNTQFTVRITNPGLVPLPNLGGTIHWTAQTP